MSNAFRPDCTVFVTLLVFLCRCSTCSWHRGMPWQKAQRPLNAVDLGARSAASPRTGRVLDVFNWQFNRRMRCPVRFDIPTLLPVACGPMIQRTVGMRAVVDERLLALGRGESASDLDRLAIPAQE